LFLNNLETAQTSSHMPLIRANYGVTSSALISEYRLHVSYKMRSLTCGESCLYSPERFTTMSPQKYPGVSHPGECLSEEDLRDIEKAKDDIQHGRVYTTEQLMHKLGL